MLNFRNLLACASVVAFAGFGLSAFGETADAPPPASLTTNEVQITSTIEQPALEGVVIIDDQDMEIGDVFENATIGEELTEEELGQLIQKVTQRGHRPRRYNRCSNCTYYGINPAGTFKLGHCRDPRNNRVRHCSQRL